MGECSTDPLLAFSTFRVVNRRSLTDRRACIVTYPCLSLSEAPTDSRIEERCIGRNSQRMTTVTEWNDPIVFDSLLRGEAV
jgi:hypothetical protein